MGTSGSVVGAELVAQLVTRDVSALGADALLEQMAQWEAVRSWAEAMQNDVLVAWEREQTVAVPVAAGVAGTWHCDQVGVALGVGSSAAMARVDAAVRLRREAPATREALRSGRITGHHARLLLRATRTCGPDVARAVDEAAMSDDGWRTPRQLEDTARKLVVRFDPDGASARHRVAVGDRGVRMQAADDGMATLRALLPAEDAQTVMAALDAAARAVPADADERTMGQRRADALVEFCADRLAGPSAPRKHGRKATVQVTVAWSTLIGCDDAPADLAGYGPIDADTARRIASDPSSTWRRLLTDPTSGQLLDYGRTVHRPPPDLAAFVVARDATCRHPACDRSASGCDLDHRQRWADGGVTAPGNVDALCRRHHREKDEGGWIHERDPATGDSRWTTPSGRVVGKAGHRLPRPPDLAPPV